MKNDLAKEREYYNSYRNRGFAVLPKEVQALADRNEMLCQEIEYLRDHQALESDQPKVLREGEAQAAIDAVADKQAPAMATIDTGEVLTPTVIAKEPEVPQS